jgi:VIT1/CCC1 family predicted Fe2+/Mn2+ transporter
MKSAYRAGFNFGLSSGIITTIGLMVGLYSSTNSRLVVIGGILTIAIADALSDALGIHMASESLHKYSIKKIWEATYSTFIYKFIFSSIFIIPILLLKLIHAVIISLLIGIYLIFANSLIMARQQNRIAWKVISTHLLLTLGVIVITYCIGISISIFFS